MTAETLMQWIARYGYAGIFLWLMLGIVGLPVPDDTLLAFAGYLVFKGRLHPAPTLAAAFLGSVSGITISYTLGRTAGTYLVEKFGGRLHLTAERLEDAHRWFERLGRWVLVVGYFVPGVRHLTAFVAGSSRLKLRVFALYAYTGGLIWSATFIAAGYFLGEKWVTAGAAFRHHLIIAACLGAFIFIAAWLVQRRNVPRATRP